jgi:hypothetical protein
MSGNKPFFPFIPAASWLVCKMVLAIYRHFSFYDNQMEGFSPRTIQGATTELRRANRQLANVFVNEVATNSVTFNSAQGLNFLFVDFEICPIRTTRSEFKTREPGRRGRGRLDLLLGKSRRPTADCG